MKAVQDRLQKISIDEKYLPLAFLVITFICFGLLANRLGFYQDDWPYVFYAFNKGVPSLRQELFYDSRPNAAWLYIGLFYLLKFNPLAWHYAAAIFRWLTATMLWYFLRRLWSQNLREVTFAILIFLVHPFFLIQPYAVNSILYWAGYLFFGSSLLIMARSLTAEKGRLAFTAVAVLLEGLHLFTAEYFVGLVMIRPLVLFWLIAREEQSLSVRLRRTFLHWLPYLAVLGTYVVWRIILFSPPEGGDRNAPVILYALFKTPAATIPYLIRTALQDSTIITFTSWYRTLVPELFAFGSRFGWFMIIVSALTLLATYLCLTRIESLRSTPTPRWLAAPLTLGVLIILLGMAPIWMIGQDIVTHKNQFAGSRFGIGSTLGAALVLAVIVENLMESPKKKFVVLAVCVALAVSMHLANENNFTYSWSKQERFSQQLIWRAPQLEPGTALLTDEEVLPYMGDYAVSFSVITAYRAGSTQTAPYWYFPFNYVNPNVGDLLEGVPLEGGRVGIDFAGNTKQMLLLSFIPEMQRCLWVLGPDDANLHLVSEDMRRLSAGSDIGQIKPGSGTVLNLPESIYGKQNNDTWCYYFEKGDLARQYGEWDEVVKLFEQAQAHGEAAGSGFEYIPFIEAYGHQQDWEQVKFLTKAANRITSGLEPSLCSALDRIAETGSPSQVGSGAIAELKQYLKCVNYQ